MKRRTFYHISLSLPYIALLIGGAFAYFVNGLNILNEVPLSSPNILTGMLVFFTVSAMIWGPLYTWMVVAMLFWGRGKSTQAVRRLYILSPLLFACSMGLPAMLIAIPDSGLFLLWGFLHINNLDFVMPALVENYYQEQSMTIGLAWAFMAALSVVIGYAFVGLALLIERALERRNLFKREAGIDSL